MASDLGDQVLRDLEVIGREVEACKDCLEEGVTRVHRTLGRKEAPPAAEPKSEPLAEEDLTPSRPPIPLDGPEPIIKDQVFEAYSDPNEMDFCADRDELTLEERVGIGWKKKKVS